MTDEKSKPDYVFNAVITLALLGMAAILAHAFYEIFIKGLPK